jgi:copper homeostasis protein
MPFLEIASFNATSALIAASSNANRIELCTNPSVGGTTPSLSTFQSLKSNPSVKIPIYVMIRPHGVSFTYTNAEVQTMKTEIESFKLVGADGFVFGILTPDGRVDRENCKILLAAAEGSKCTFHRAFDEILEERMEEELEILIDLGFANVLTSGGGKTAVEGTDVLKSLVEKAKGRIEIIVGGGVRDENVKMLRNIIGANWFHSSAVTDGGEVASAEEVRGLGDLLR